MHVKAAGQRIDYDAGGTGRPLLAVHGWTSDRHTFMALRPHLEASYRVLAPDLPGFGASPAPDDGPVTLAYYADLMAAFLATLQIEEPVLLMGHSMGAQIALEMIAARPDAYTGAVLLDPAPIVWTDKMRCGMEATRAGLGRDPQATLTALRDKAFFRGHEPDWLRDEIAATAAAADPAVTRAAFDAMLDWDGPAALARAAARPLLYVGADRPQNREQDIRAHAPAIHWGRTVGHGHFNHVLAAEQVLAMIDTFRTLTRV
ncbi:pimeloyl-ACP methyl ester carboxylesterase [Rhodothalassium salexigens DSM 2132]|uniref:Pimeloyl-ACP methyl ester carboxylesterase n=1 Tax=Rhodothalassium salexigens DSM 2132 TaxID=1188247 RepID=A0A4R2PRQ5_RHOSA|nr:alpha/beta hydrolase [Rhodothalassium salexigens]MBB4210710.1 pimeloyl-ACP methyl ester carboxylesterase [Rhodothalassium salexigens DSM 2132]MBK1637911.1 hypothetical protein [Rhodothalassium salexigens DSM 2132]TCP37734.1 pimeloyl-ACP methyl ester carboxylesterase [Rhodothalassium salexigens DSM 2132]